MILPLLLLIQITPTPPIERGTALPPPGVDEAAVMAPVDAVLAAITTNDRVAIEARLMPGGSATVAVERADGSRLVRRLAWTEWLAAFDPARREQARETQGTPAIEIDGDMAMVWAPYTFYVDGKLRHCGTNHWSLVRDGGRWKIADIAWSQRTTGCPAR